MLDYWFIIFSVQKYIIFLKHHEQYRLSEQQTESTREHTTHHATTVETIASSGEAGIFEGEL